jgi:hypothetical protein
VPRCLTGFSNGNTMRAVRPDLQGIVRRNDGSEQLGRINRVETAAPSPPTAGLGLAF